MRLAKWHLLGLVLTGIGTTEGTVTLGVRGGSDKVADSEDGNPDEEIDSFGPSIWDESFEQVEVNQCWAGSFDHQASTTLKTSQRVGTVVAPPVDYSLSFKIRPTARLSGWRNIIHFTSTGKNIGSYGDRVPAIWFHHASTRLHLCVGTTTNANTCWNSPTQLPLNRESAIVLLVKGKSATIKLNGNAWGTMALGPRTQLKHVDVYLGDPWYGAAAATVSHLSYKDVHTKSNSGMNLGTRYESNYEKIYADHGTGSRRDLSVWRPYLLSGEYRVTYTAQPNYSSPNFSSVVVKELTPGSGALKAPKHLVVRWTDRSTGGSRDGQLYKAVPHDGYKCLSDLAVYKSNSGLYPDKIVSASSVDPHFMCVHESLVVVTTLAASPSWTDAGSGGTYDGATWQINNSAGMRVSRGGGDRPPHGQYKLKAIPRTLFKDMLRVAGSSNCNLSQTIKKTYNYEVGLEISQSTSETVTKEIETEISATVQSGIEYGPVSASAEMTTTFRERAGTSTTISSSNIQTSKQQLSAEYELPPGTRIDIYQAIVIDANQRTSSGIKLYTLEFEYRQSKVKCEDEEEEVTEPAKLG